MSPRGASVRLQLVGVALWDKPSVGDERELRLRNVGDGRRGLDDVELRRQQLAFKGLALDFLHHHVDGALRGVLRLFLVEYYVADDVALGGGASDASAGQQPQAYARHDGRDVAELRRHYAGLDDVGVFPEKVDGRVLGVHPRYCRYMQLARDGGGHIAAADAVAARVEGRPRDEEVGLQLADYGETLGGRARRVVGEVVVAAYHRRDYLAAVLQKILKELGRAYGLMLYGKADVGHLLSADLAEELVYIADDPPFFLFHNAAHPLIIHGLAV